MTPKKIWANYAVADVERTREFYTLLGFKPNKGFDAEIASFLVGENNFLVHFF